LIKTGYIRPSSSFWRVLVLFVRKKDEDLRMCIDYRVLNKMMVQNEYPLSKINELLNTLQSAKFFTTLNLDMAYHQIRIKEEDIAKTAFTCMERHYEFLVITFGLTNTPAMFQEIMNKVFQK
jgi:Reverse transcriptase (RNA-dependent DNA polymerase)